MKCPTCNGEGEIAENASSRLRPEGLEIGKFIFYANGPHKIVAIQFPSIVVRSRRGLDCLTSYYSRMTEVAPAMLEALGGAF